MSINPTSAAFTGEQKEYLAGFFAGVAQRGMRFSDAAPVAKEAPEEAEDLIFEERVKRELHPLDAYGQILENALGNKAPDKEETFRFKWNGLFFLTPIKDAYMSRLRIPGGFLSTHQLREIARIAEQLTTGYVQITTRANFQLRLIEPKNAPEFLRRVQSVGLHTRGAGADNIRNLTANPTAGIDPVELIDVRPYVEELGARIINDRVFYDLPRKFNIALDGGGLIGSVEDTNDIGVKAVRVEPGSGLFEETPVAFRIALGGATGHKAFARDVGVLVPPDQMVKVVLAMVRVFIAKGNRGDRKKARLKHLLEKMSLADYLAETEKLLGFPLTRSEYDPSKMRWASQELSHSHVGDFSQKQRGLNYLGVAIPVGHITPKQMLRVAELADLYGSSEVRLTVWQNLIIPNVSDAFVPTLKKALEKCGLGTRQSHFSSGVIACTGSRYCKFAQADTKGHALELINKLESRIDLDQPVNIHFTGCPNSCAQHFMGDIGLMGVKAQGEEAYHVFVGGGFGKHQAVGRQLFSGVIAKELPALIDKMLRGYLRLRDGKETFLAFTARHEVGKLQEFFSE
jgi:ferredoxin-nitrite reductase